MWRAAGASDGGVGRCFLGLLPPPIYPSIHVSDEGLAGRGGFQGKGCTPRWRSCVWWGVCHSAFCPDLQWQCSWERSHGIGHEVTSLPADLFFFSGWPSTRLCSVYGLFAVAKAGADTWGEWLDLGGLESLGHDLWDTRPRAEGHRLESWVCGQVSTGEPHGSEA